MSNVFFITASGSAINVGLVGKDLSMVTDRLNGLNSSKVVMYAIDAGAGDCILVHQVEENVKVLIDSGPSKGTGRLNVHKALSEILNKNNFIDLAIVTHNDDDHIGGFANLIRNKVISVGAFLFNDASYINKVINKDHDKFSLRQDVGLREDLERIDITVHNVHNTGAEPNKFSCKGIDLTVLSPNEEKLKKYSIWLAKQGQVVKQPCKFSLPADLPSLSKAGFEQIIKDVIERDDFTEDDSLSNGTSLAFILEVGNKRFLFLGDAHPSLVQESLGQLKETKFDLCKLSHHGSDKNTSKSFLKALTCDDFLICSDGKTYNHPSLVAIARVLISNPNARFYFSSSTEKNRALATLLPNESFLSDSNFLKVEY